MEVLVAFPLTSNVVMQSMPKIVTYAHYTSNTTYLYKNSSGNEIANVNFYAVRPEATRIR